ncbi:Phage FluMu protein gp47 [Pseudomonas savastanoi pv. nerii]|uniref:Phage FluMu protein gp47 n=1 Tax=Pseudomonas savastanoi pv. nerii TaxID=360921 RepID=A0A0P9X0A2_PSESS|nr:Phage FluMu protein gp47 [Pseudomonas savastanoi]KPW71162.1 Phage FluMu protein gp47 [Pseudomonas amygdali pv. ciccaronei]KPY12246.1 Phage FluMu protein gp47 [Pseudomonas savastanoi pv. nerii]KPY65482.1 Baseplate J-like protein [Pseudomonas savastanoi pv. savastanoi]KUG44273.1 Baseplate J-like protein [Pseudomonas savastanoi pv. fraxini]RML14048.1 Baseplate J-like protein [Pseudomonas savastanoi pv. retacarpa]
MPFETPTLPALINRTQVDLADEALRQSDARVLSRAHSGAAYGLYGYQDWIADQILPDTADEETLERQAILRLRQPRKVAQAATGSVRFTAAAGAVLDVDTVLQFSDGRFYRVTKGVTTVAGNNTTTVEAVDAGVLGNADAGLAMTAVQPVEGIDSRHRQHLHRHCRRTFRRYRAGKYRVVACSCGAFLSGHSAWRQSGRLRDLGAGSAGRNARLVCASLHGAGHGGGVLHA